MEETRSIKLVLSPNKSGNVAWYLVSVSDKMGCFLLQYLVCVCVPHCIVFVGGYEVLFVFYIRGGGRCSPGSHVCCAVLFLLPAGAH